ncbi:MAG: hypothetical protein QM500_15750 [Methylococcales bacterium]
MDGLGKHITAIILFAVLLVPTIGNAALVGRLAATEGGTDYQAYYDTETDLTWLADANAAGAAMRWDAANTGQRDWKLVVSLVGVCQR